MPSKGISPLYHIASPPPIIHRMSGRAHVMMYKSYKHQPL